MSPDRGNLAAASGPVFLQAFSRDTANGLRDRTFNSTFANVAIGKRSCGVRFRQLPYANSLL